MRLRQGASPILRALAIGGLPEAGGADVFVPRRALLGRIPAAVRRLVLPFVARRGPRPAPPAAAPRPAADEVARVGHGLAPEDEPVVGRAPAIRRLVQVAVQALARVRADLAVDLPLVAVVEGRVDGGRSRDVAVRRLSDPRRVVRAHLYQPGRLPAQSDQGYEPMEPGLP